MPGLVLNWTETAPALPPVRVTGMEMVPPFSFTLAVAAPSTREPMLGGS